MKTEAVSAVLYTTSASYEAKKNLETMLQAYCSDQSISVKGKFSDVNPKRYKRFQGLFEALELLQNSALEEKPIDYLIITVPEIPGYNMNILCAELAHYNTELKVIENYK